MIDVRNIILGPVITEKSNLHKESYNQITFEVDKRANKLQIKEAVEKMFNVRVESVRTVNCVGKKRRLGRFEGKKRDWKKAIVKLKEGDRIEFFEGA